MKIYNLKDVFANLYIGNIIMIFIIILNKFITNDGMNNSWYGWSLVLLVGVAVAKELLYAKFTKAKIDILDGIMVPIGGLIVAIFTELIMGNSIFH